MAARKKKNSFREDLKFEIYGLLLLTFAIIALVGYGKMRYVSLVFFFLAGSWYFLIPLAIAASGIYFMLKRQWLKKIPFRLTGFIMIMLAFLLLSHVRFYEIHLPESAELSVLAYTAQQLWAQRADFLAGGTTAGAGGGMIGALLFSFLYWLLDLAGTKLVSLLLILIGLLFLTNRSILRGLGMLKNGLGQYLTRLRKGILQFYLRRLERKEQAKQAADQALAEEEKATAEDGAEGGVAIHDFVQREDIQARQQEVQPAEPEAQERQNPRQRAEEEEADVEPLTFQQPAVTHYQLPGLNLLQPPSKKAAAGSKAILASKQKLERTLESFGVKAKVTQIHRGPAVTRFELQPSTGVKVSRIVSLADDVALALAARDIRIEAPIPGKSAVGIEVPNPEVAVVTLREVLESSAYQQSLSPLTIALGRDISGEPVVADLSKMPHLLVAGATGSGKSVCINSIIISILYKSRPDDVQFLMIDPKMVELSIYNNIPHQLIPVVTDPRKAAMALKKVVMEMEHRYRLFASSGARDIQRYNQLMTENGQDKLPYIVVIIDELADLMMVAPADVEEAISRLAQMARAAGIHLLIATQRPSVDVITGLIKANIPSRIAFGVSSQIDSRTILDMAGAERLLGRGDMLYLPVGESKPIRIQGAFISDKEVESVVRHVQSQQEAEYREDLIPEDVVSSDTEQMEDELYEAALRLVVENQQASVSFLQRRLRIGYTRAARLIDALEQQGIIGPYEGSKPREVLVRPDQVG